MHNQRLAHSFIDGGLPSVLAAGQHVQANSVRRELD
jgi:hypothetical protein